MGDPRRFDVFARFIGEHFQPSVRIADVAGGKGYLQRALRSRGFLHIHTYDKRKGRRHRPGRFEYSYRFFDDTVKEQYGLLVGMHPDDATDVIIVEAARRSIPFVLCPCCIKPRAAAYWGDYNFNNWVAHLSQLSNRLGFSLTTSCLKMNGRNLVMFGYPLRPTP